MNIVYSAGFSVLGIIDDEGFLTHIDDHVRKMDEKNINKFRTSYNGFGAEITKIDGDYIVDVLFLKG